MSLHALVVQMVDVGCGIGGSSRHISRMFGCTAQGITLSPVQAARANELSKAAGLGDKCRFQVRHVSASDARAVHTRSTSARQFDQLACYMDTAPLGLLQSNCTLWIPDCSLANCFLLTRCVFCRQVGDALQQPFPDNSFDLVWSMVSAHRQGLCTLLVS